MLIILIKKCTFLFIYVLLLSRFFGLHASWAIGNIPVAIPQRSSASQHHSSLILITSDIPVGVGSYCDNSTVIFTSEVESSMQFCVIVQRLPPLTYQSFLLIYWLLSSRFFRKCPISGNWDIYARGQNNRSVNNDLLFIHAHHVGLTHVGSTSVWCSFREI